MGLISVNVGYALGGGALVGAVERTFHQALVEVAGYGHVKVGGFLCGYGALIQNSCYHIEGVAAAGGVGDYGFFQSAPDSAVKAVLPLRGLVAMIECLFVLPNRALPVVRGHKVAFTVAQAACIVQAALLRKANGGVICPILVAAYVFIRPHRGMHSVGCPEWCVLGFVVKDGVVARLITGCWMRKSVRCNLALIVAGIIPVPDIVAVRYRSCASGA